MLDHLVDYYEQLRSLPDSPVQSPGWSKAKVTCTINLTADGRISSVSPSVEKAGEERLVPQQPKRTRKPIPFLLCDAVEYITGVSKDGTINDRSRERLELSRKLHLDDLAEVHSPVIEAVKSYFTRWQPELIETLSDEDRRTLETARFITFALDGAQAERDPAFQEHWEIHFAEGISDGSDDTVMLPSLLSGQRQPIERTHPSIKGIAGGQSSGTNLVSFNAPSFGSFGRDDGQGLNAPVGKSEAHAYTTALNYLIDSPDHHLRMEDTTIVFWSSKDDQKLSKSFETLINMDSLFTKKVERSNVDAEVRGVLSSLAKGRKVNSPDLDAPFFILGLAPNAARLSVRFFNVSTFGQMAQNVENHYKRIDICHADGEMDYPGPAQLLKALKPEPAKKPESAKAGDKGWAAVAARLLQSIIEDTPYPASLLEQILIRVRSSPNSAVTREQAALIKAYQIKNQRKKGVTVMLNEDRRDVPYLLGRIFAVMENIQKAVSPNLNTTIKGRYFNAYCATPARVFAALVNLSSNHLDVLRRTKAGMAVNRERLLGELIAELPDCPGHLNAEDQAELILGYYQQRQSFFSGNSKTNDDDFQED